MSWLGRLTAAHELRKRQRAAQRVVENTISMDVPDRPPGWLDMGITYTLTPPPGFEVDRAVVHAIRVFCPDFVPMWANWTFLPPVDQSMRGAVVFGRHVIARRVLDPRVTRHEFSLVIPPDYTGMIPNYIELIWEGPEPYDPKNTDLPGVYRPLDWKAVADLRGAYLEAGSEVWKKRFITDPKARADKRKAAVADEKAYIMRDFNKHAMKVLEKLSDVEVKNILMGGVPTPRRG